jgi:SnoaL-like protein
MTAASRASADAWVAAYERAWRTEGTDGLGELFAEGATYRMSPFAEPAIGLVEIAALWERERQGAEEEFTMEHGIVAVEADTAVVRVEVRYGAPGRARYRDLWVLRFAPDGRCTEFEEWPFWPDQPIVAKGGEQ